eukprot:UN15665
MLWTICQTQIFHHDGFGITRFNWSDLSSFIIPGLMDLMFMRSFKNNR